MLYDGCRVMYTGANIQDGPQLTDEGAVLIMGERSAHVQWRTGSLAERVSLVDVRDLMSMEARRGVEDALDDSLEVSGLGTFTARQIFDEAGPEGLLNALVDSGHLASFTPIAEEALALVTGRLRASMAQQGMTAHLDDSEVEEVVRTAAAALIRDAFSPE